MPPAGDPFHCQPIPCGNPYGCPGFTIYLNHHQHHGSGSGMAKNVNHDGDGDGDDMRNKTSYRRERRRKVSQRIEGEFCKKGCDADGDTWDECLGECDEMCYKDPVLKDKQWSAYIDRSPGSASYSEECFRACVAGCGYKDNSDYRENSTSDVKALHLTSPAVSERITLTSASSEFDIPAETINQVHSRPPKPPPEEKPAPPATPTTDEMPSTSA
ncbi:hypothetical protein Sango_2531100 [Sesamum angolense]|uniref:Uncharacterized protein n=1 Tax=Sesamum angolense TaxID=2727404 RepID=A0AAE1W4G9_9LAMI|nr:hypothetical protein Sango_2531100 [Sesamum angolense]